MATDPKAPYDPGDQFLPRELEAAGGPSTGWRTWVYWAAVAIGAALTMHDELNPYQLTHRPQMPVLFLTNQSELAKPTAYVERAVAAPDHPTVIWVVKRDGHCNVNSAETRAALDALVQCARTGRLKPGELVLMVAFGAGMSWGATLVRV